MAKNKSEQTMGTLIRITVLSWAAALLTASYAGLLPKMDPTFIATVFTASAATFGVNTMKKDSEKDDADKPTRRDPEPELVVDTESYAEPTIATEATSGCPECGSGDSPDYNRSTTTV
jgi:hypothetical protein